ncbi:NAD P-binding protein [Gloeophyllum trabeum ATCC 11539]|uniref:NAD P-binding protein n=1 Tax=Gloeophyllum trabeum (strain ATCC 11539 / FP-39264 / Madison 617) TaxID=670483 RepID=S7RMX0_GLOTA|nr:NAD P-binding protein [Gloeophyllum trabeum ATCC 11539]EPQ54044.1 NAD P-binding protein [Gloeophyllum trabeum ATCC 11539]
MSSAKLQNVAIFGATGNIGQHIFRALANPQLPSYKPNITVFLRPGTTQSKKASFPSSVRILEADPSDRAQLAQALRGIDVVISVLSGPGIDAQRDLLEAAVEAGVKRFYPSEWGFHNVYRKPGDEWGHIHPLWDQKARFADWLVRHPAVESGRITYTIIGNGDFYDQEWEYIWCAWAQDPARVGPQYKMYILGDANAKVDWSSLDDVANFAVATLARPEDSCNRTLNFPSDTVSQVRIAQMLEEYSGKPVERVHVPMEEVHRVIEDPSRAPKEVAESSKIPVQFWYTVKGCQGMGIGYRPAEFNHHEAWPEVKRTSIEEYFKRKFDRS